MPWREDENYAYGDGIYRAISDQDPKYPASAVIDALNMVYFRESENPRAMDGASRLGATDMGGVVTGLFDYDNGTTLVATASDGKLYTYGTDWTALGTGARKSGNDTTATTRWHGTMMYGATTAKDLLVLGNGIDKPLKYETTSGATDLGATAPATGNYPAVWQGKLFLAVDDTLYGSVTNNCEDFLAGNGGVNIAVAKGNDGAITSLYPFANNLFIFKASSIYRISPTSTFTEVNVKNVSSAVGCVSHETVKEVMTSSGPALTFLSENGVVMMHSSAVAAGFSIKPISRNVKELYDRVNKSAIKSSFGMWNLDRLEYYLMYPVGSQTTPTEALVANMARPNKPIRWTRMNRSGLTAGLVYNKGNTDYIQYVGDSSGRVYKMHDESTMLWDGSAIQSRVITRVMSQNAPNMMKQYGWSWVDVEKETVNPLTVKQVMIRGGLPTASGNVNALTGTSVDSGWGTGEWGVALWGGSGNDGQRIRPESVSRAQGLRLIVEGSSQSWKLLGSIVAYEYASDNIGA